MGNFIGKILGTGAKETIEAIGDTIDKIDKSDEKMMLQLRYKQLIVDMESKCVEYESKLLDSQTRILQSETQDGNWLQRNWRPILMMVCIFIVFNNYVLVPYFQIPSVVLDDNIWSLIHVGVAGYIGGRSLEKITDSLGGILVSKDRKK